MQTLQPPKKRNFAISYIKGVAIIFIILIHLFDWGDIVLGPVGKSLKQILYPGVVFFMLTVGSVVYIAYGHKDWRYASKRLLSRGLQLVGIYYAYNIVKFFIFDFSREDFYYGFMEQGIFGWKDIVTLKSFAVPIPILLTIGLFLILSPLFLWLAQKNKYAKPIFLSLLGLVILINYFLPLPVNSFTNFFYARGNITFAILFWFVPYLLGFYLALDGFEQNALKRFVFFLSLTGLTYWYAFVHKLPLLPEYSLHPLQFQTISLSFAFLYLLIPFFRFLEKQKKSFLNTVLAGLRVLGDFTLWLYVVHWIVIDLTLYVVYPKTYWIWLTVPLLLVFFFWWKRKKVKEYQAEYAAETI